MSLRITLLLQFMKRSLPIITLSTIAVIGISIPAFTNAGGAPSGRTGGPSASGQTCATAGCHAGGPSVSSQTIDISHDIPATGFEANTDYTITVTANANGSVGSRIGFQASVENSSGAHQGSISTANSRTIKSGANYITHSSGGITPTSGTNTWSFTWNSGNAENGATIYVATNFANGNGTTSGDVIGTAMEVLTKSSIGLLEENVSGLSLFPTPAKDYTTLKFSLTQGAEFGYSIVSVDGKVVRTVSDEKLSEGDHTIRIETADLQSGSYILQLKIDNMMRAMRFTRL